MKRMILLACTMMLALCLSVGSVFGEDTIPVKSIKPESEEIILLLGASEDLAKGKINITVKPEDTTVKDFVFISGKEEVVTVDNEGNLQAVGAGKATITIAPNEEKPKVKATCTVKVGNAVTGIEIPASKTINKGKTFIIKPTILPADAMIKKVEYTTSDESVATVSKEGTVKGVACGTAVITCTAADGSGVSASCEITVIQPVKSVKADPSNVTLLLGASAQMAQGQVNPVIAPDDSTVKTCLFTSSDESIVTVDSEGRLKAVGPGKAKITIVPDEEGTQVKGTCSITVGNAVTKIEIPSSQTINKGQTFTIKPNLLPKDALIKDVIYTSSDESVATVSKSGTVKAVKCGEATITCQAADGSGVKATCTITVIQPVTQITTEVKKIVLFQGNSRKWFVSVGPSDATIKEVKYSSSDSRVAAVDDRGNITAKSAGKATITATSTDGSNKSCTCNVVVEPVVPISLDSIGFGIYNYNLLGITVTNQCSTLTIVDFDFDLAFYSYSGSMINGGSFSLGKQTRIGPKRRQTIKRTVYGTGQAYKTVMTITGVYFSDGSYYSIPTASQETWTFTR